MTKIKTAMCTMAILLLTQALASADKTITFENNKLEPVKAISGSWYINSGKLCQMDDASDNQNRPLFAAFPKDNIDDMMLSINYEVFDENGDIYLCPVWIDPNNYTAVLWCGHGTVQLASVVENKKTILAEKKLEGIKPPLTMSAAISGNGIRGYINNEMILDAGVIFPKSQTAAIGLLRRTIAVRKIEEKKANPWDVNNASLCPIKISTPVLGRSVFYRMEENAQLSLNLKNLTGETLPSVKLKMQVLDIVAEKTIDNVAPKQSVEFTFPVPANRLRPDDYKVSVHGESQGFKAYDEDFSFTIAKRPNKERMPYMCWGDIPVQGCKTLSDMGFTYAMNGWVDYQYIIDNPDAKVAILSNDYLGNQLKANEDAMKNGLLTGINLNTSEARLKKLSELARVKRDGSIVHGRSDDDFPVCPLLPKTQEYARRIAKVMMKTFATHPAFVFANFNSEARGGSCCPCFHKEDRDDYKKATGQEIPEGDLDKHGISYTTIPDFPKNRIVPDNHPLLTYFNWYWKRGDGWVVVNDILQETCKQNCSHEFLCWQDPVIRSAPVYGSGGKLDMIGQWTYTNLDPIRVGMNADELINMAQGKQKIYQNVQAIWYKSETAVKIERKTKGKGEIKGDYDPSFNYITPSPSHMKEGLWTAMSRPVDMIGIHGINSLLPGNGGGYPMTQPDTAKAMEDLNKELILPFGPMLRKIGNRPADVAFLESFASQVFAKKGRFGWVSDYWMVCQYAGLQSDIIFEETIREKGLDKYKVLVLSDCDVLTQSVFDKIVEFQKKGGIVIADEFIAPAVKPDITVTSIQVDWPRDGESYKKAVLEKANEVRKQLNGKYSFFAFSENPEVVLHTRENDGVQYIFAINDAKEYGDYVGQFGVVMENGLFAESVIAVRRSDVKVFDLLDGQEVPCKSDGKAITFKASLNPGDGRIFVLIPNEPAKLNVTAPQKAKRGQTVKFDIALSDKNNKPAAAVMPLSVEICDPAFRPAEPSGFYAVEKGKAQITLDIADNDRIGPWTIKVKELMTGLSKTICLEVE